MERRLKILLSAYYFSPYRGSESAVGWNVAFRLAEFADVTVIFGDLSSKNPMLVDWKCWCAKHPDGIPGLRAVHVAADEKAVTIHDRHALPGLWFFYYWAYRRWQRQVMKVACELHAKDPFDLAHHLTIIGYREPGELWNLGIPFIWGPINGAAMTPWNFLLGFAWKGRYRHVSRNLLNALQMRFSKRPRAAAKKAAKIWAVTKEDQEMVERLWGCEAERMIETGSTPDPVACLRTFYSGETLRLMWCGIIEDRKALHLLIEALAVQGKKQPFALHIVGNGPEEARCRALAVKHGLSDHITWHGRVEHATVKCLMAECHVLVHTAIKEGTPHVVLEALSSGLPVLCHDACGMGYAVDETCGLKILLRTPTASVAGFAEALHSLHTSPERIAVLSAGAIARSHTLTWRNITERIYQVYREVALATKGSFK